MKGRRKIDKTDRGILPRCVLFFNYLRYCGKVFAFALPKVYNRHTSFPFLFKEVLSMKKLLQLLEDDCTLNQAQLASLAGMSEAEVAAAIAEYEKEKIILGYKAIVDWDRTHRESVTALIEVSVTPQRGEGFDRIAERIYQYDEVESVYLMSGSFDLTVIISGRTLKELAMFVGQKLAPLEGVTGTATHFILKKYKEKHLIFQKQETQEERFVFE